MIWPNWTGKAVAIVASGPSVDRKAVAALEGRLTVLAIKHNHEIAPFAAVVYGCDYPWWAMVRGLPTFAGLRLSYDPRDLAAVGVHKIEIEKQTDRLLFEKTGTVGSGGNSGFQALNLALQFGARRVALIGFDCQIRSGVHWYGRNSGVGMNNPSETNFPRWIRSLKTAAGQAKEMGVDVVNTSPISDVKGFEWATLAATLERWGV